MIFQCFDRIYTQNIFQSDTLFISNCHSLCFILNTAPSVNVTQDGNGSNTEDNCRTVGESDDDGGVVCVCVVGG